MPRSPLPEEPEEPEEPEDASPADLVERPIMVPTSYGGEIQMRWFQRSELDDEPVLLELAIGEPSAAADLGSHLLPGIIDVDLKPPSDLCEDVEPAPPGTPVPVGTGQVLRTCQHLGALFNVR